MSDVTLESLRADLLAKREALRACENVVTDLRERLETASHAERRAELARNEARGALLRHVEDGGT